MKRSKTIRSTTSPSAKKLVRSSFRHHRSLLGGGLLAVVLVLITSAWFGWRLESQRAASDAIRMAQRSSFHSAEPMLRHALLRDSGNADLFRTLANGLFEANRFEEAEKVLTQWCNAHPNKAEPYRRRMELRYARGIQAKPGDARERLNESALSDGQRVIELEPGDVATARNVVWLLLAVGQFEDANRLCRQYVKLQPGDRELLYLQARVCHGLGENLEAQTLVDEILSHSLRFTPALMLRGILYYEAGRVEEAIPIFLAVSTQADGSPNEARYHLGLALARAGRTEEARKVMAEVQRHNFERDSVAVDSLAVRVRRAELLFDCGRDDEALASLQTVLVAHQGNAAAHRLLASYYGRRGETDKAAHHQQMAQRGERQP